MKKSTKWSIVSSVASMVGYGGLWATQGWKVALLVWVCLAAYGIERYVERLQARDE